MFVSQSEVSLQHDWIVVVSFKINRLTESAMPEWVNEWISKREKTEKLLREKISRLMKQAQAEKQQARHQK
jgi:hypothetical protein